MARSAQSLLLPTVLRHAEENLNRWIAQSSAAQDEMAALEGRSMCVEIEKTNWTITLSILDQRVRLADSAAAADADICIRAGLFELLELLRARSVAQLSGGEIQFRGSLRVAEQFSGMLRLARPQLEDELAGWIGGLPARVVSQAGGAALGWSAQASAAVARDTVDYLQCESRTLPLPHEVADFLIAVERLRDDVDRLEQRIERVASVKKR